MLSHKLNYVNVAGGTKVGLAAGGILEFVTPRVFRLPDFPTGLRHGQRGLYLIG